jgi:hypothetical protein
VDTDDVDYDEGVDHAYDSKHPPFAYVFRSKHSQLI